MKNPIKEDKMPWETFHDIYDPIQRGFMFFVMITSIYVLACLISNHVRLIYTRKGLKRIEKNFKAWNDSDQPVQFKNIEFKKSKGYCVINAILDTFKYLEKSKTEADFFRLWDLEIKILRERIDGTFFKRNPFLVICVLTICLGIPVFFKHFYFGFQKMPISGGMVDLARIISESLIIPIIASINCALSALVFLSAKNSAKKILTEITKLEIHLLERK